jgi:rare lipoprotein A (peptidoglycan hydrolase)
MVFHIQRNEPLPISDQPAKVRMKIVRPLRLASSVSPLTRERPLQNTSDIQRKSFESVLRAEKGNATSGRTSERWVEYTIKDKDTLWVLAVKRFHVNVDDLIRDNGIKDPRKIQPGQKIRVRLPSYPKRMNVVASWYGEEHHGKAMANGEPFDMNAAIIAHKEIPLGTKVELENPLTGERVKAVVADRGPYVAGRDVDLSYGLAKRLSMVEKGVGPLVMRVIG